MNYFINRIFCFFLGHPVRRIDESIILTKEVCQRCGCQFVGNKEQGTMLRWNHDDPTLVQVFNLKWSNDRSPVDKN
jgi:hypothetical protein